MVYYLKLPTTKAILLKYLEYVEKEHIDYERIFTTKEYIIRRYSNFKSPDTYYLCVRYDKYVNCYWLGLFEEIQANNIPFNPCYKSVTIF